MGRGGNQAEKQPQCQAQQTLRGAPELKGPICVTSFPLGPIPFLDVGYLGKVTTLGEPTLWLSRFLKGLIDSSRLSDDSTQSSWGYSPSLRKELGAASLCDHHTECGRTERDWGGSAAWERVVKEALSGGFFLSFSVMLR